MVHPVTFLKYKPLRYRVICCTVAWIISFGSCFCCLFTLVLLNFYICMHKLDSVPPLPLHPVVLSCGCSQSSEAVRTRRERERERGGTSHEERAFYLIVITTVSMAIIYMPFMISGFIYIMTQRHINEPLSFGFVCFNSGWFVQPVIYLHRAGKLFCPCSL